MNLIDVIMEHARSQAAAEDWQTVVEVIKSLGIRNEPRLCYIIESGETVEAAGDDGTFILGAMQLDPNGLVLFSKLANSVGVVWAHPKTQQWLSWFVSQGRMSQAGADALIDLSSPLTYERLTEAECKSAVLAERSRQTYETIQNRRQQWDVIAADIRSRIESGALVDDAAVVAAVQSALS